MHNISLGGEVDNLYSQSEMQMTLEITAIAAPCNYCRPHQQWEVKQPEDFDKWSKLEFLSFFVEEIVSVWPWAINVDAK